MARLIDTNVILRVILNDNPDMAREAAAVIDEGAWTTKEAIAEVVYVLGKTYGIPRAEVVEYLEQVLALIETENNEVVRAALALYRDTHLDFVDCVMIGYNHVEKINVFSFDKKLNKHLIEYM